MRNQYQIEILVSKLERLNDERNEYIRMWGSSVSKWRMEDWDKEIMKIAAEIDRLQGGVVVVERVVVREPVVVERVREVREVREIRTYNDDFSDALLLAGATAAVLSIFDSLTRKK